MDSKKRKKQLRASSIAELKEMTKKVKLVERNEDPHKVQDILNTHLTRSNSLYVNIKKKLDGTAADSKHVRELLVLGHESSKKINVTRKDFDLRSILIGKMREANEDTGRRLDKQEFMKYIVDTYVNDFVKTPPSFNFFYGVLASEDLEERRKAERKRIQIVATQAATAKVRDLVHDVEQDSTPKEVEHINNQVNKLSINKPNGVPFFETLVDPKSFTQTVENIFHISFLVKEGRVGVKKNPGKKVVLTVEKAASANAASSNESQEVEQKARLMKANQSILSFSMDDYKEWIAEYNIRNRAFEPRSNDS